MKTAREHIQGINKHITYITQLQITQLGDLPNWLDAPHKCYTEYCLVLHSTDTITYLNGNPRELNDAMIANWPHYSLLPSINRVSDYYGLGYFSTDPTLWPIKFEWDYARRWLYSGSIKAVLPDGPCIRDNEAHKSTYAA